jgi:hypothetical protein
MRRALERTARVEGDGVGEYGVGVIWWLRLYRGRLVNM